MAVILKYPPILFVRNLWENYKRQQDELNKRKLNFLYQQAYINFYEQLLIKHTLRIGEDVDFHPSIYAKREAEARAKEVVLKVAADGRINHCYRARVEELRNGKI